MDVLDRIDYDAGNANVAALFCLVNRRYVLLAKKNHFPSGDTISMTGGCMSE